MDGSHLPGTRMVMTATDVRSVVASVVDPEIPVLTIADLGILRSVDVVDDSVVVTITPTYTGCPAMRQIEDDIGAVLTKAGIDSYRVVVSHNPPWTTDWIAETARQKLNAFGIAPPGPTESVLCPQCESGGARVIARFGSTACKALMVCSSCGEPFDLFKEF